LVCMGYGPLENLIKNKSRCSNNIYAHQAVPPDILLKYTSSADYGVLFYEDTCLNHRYCSPNKIFEYMMAGLPVLVSNLFEMKRLVNTHEVGFVALEYSTNGFKDAIEILINKDYKKMVSNVIESSKLFCWEAQEKVLKTIYHDV
jgi:glycosyltransferase involved in cell wall biosynthesis